MGVIRAKFARGMETRCWTQQEFLDSIHRALEACAAPVVRSAGQRGRFRMMAGPPLSLGYISRCEYIDFDMAEALTAAALGARLRPCLPSGVTLLWLRRLPAQALGIKAAVRGFTYRVGGAFSPARVAAFRAAPTWPWVRKKPGGERILDLKKSVARLEAFPDELWMDIVVREEGTPKPTEVLAAVFTVAEDAMHEWVMERIAMRFAPEFRPGHGTGS
ncbi:MAG TPA: TIGR03936 family radical SAM-associated protein [Candidatus Hydrogenedentes bacterium]|nr:TIGR03936 family radical SAM-associated protein [Candidatus Hydrogenedentota bacterium]HOS03207.1 TIGR03936 family radical SAM-associated protein [Candidatus Hydrogenedentota bacterium]